jgi:hypothetical protein
VSEGPVGNQVDSTSLPSHRPRQCGDGCDACARAAGSARVRKKLCPARRRRRSGQSFNSRAELGFLPTHLSAPPAPWITNLTCTPRRQPSAVSTIMCVPCSKTRLQRTMSLCLGCHAHSRGGVFASHRALLVSVNPALGCLRAARADGASASLHHGVRAETQNEDRTGQTTRHPGAGRWAVCVQATRTPHTRAPHPVVPPCPLA